MSDRGRYFMSISKFVPSFFAALLGALVISQPAPAGAECLPLSCNPGEVFRCCDTPNTQDACCFDSYGGRRTGAVCCRAGEGLCPLPSPGPTLIPPPPTPTPTPVTCRAEWNAVFEALFNLETKLLALYDCSVRDCHAEPVNPQHTPTPVRTCPPNAQCAPF